MAEDKSKTAQLERLNNDEFRELMPYLQAEELLSIQIEIKDNWEYLFKICRKKEKFNGLLCSVCNINVLYDNFQSHVKLETHINGLKKVNQFYQPIYTYAKCSVKLARGETVSKTELKDGINKAIDQKVKIKLGKAKRLAYNLANKKRDPLKFENVLLSLVLKTDAKMPEHIFADVGLPLMDLLSIEFCKEDDKWIPMLTTSNPLPNGKYLCGICSKYCAGIITVNAHLNGFFHKRLQLATLGVRVATHTHLTKNCSYRYDDTKYSLSIRREGREFFRDDVLKIIRSNNTQDLNELSSRTENDKKGNDSDKAEAVVESDYKAEEIKKVVIKIEPEESTETVQSSAANEQKNVVVAEKLKPELSKAIASKAKALAANIPVILNSAAAENSLSIDTEGLIGVEYVVKLLKSANDSTPSYECCLCEMVFHEGRMHGHLISYGHRIKYLGMHYPDAIKKYSNEIGHHKYQTFKRVMAPILSKLATAIEKHHGRSLPFSVSASKFEQQRPEIVAEAYNFNHASQQHGPSFSNVVSPEEIKYFITNSNFYKPPFVPDSHRGRFMITPTDKTYLNMHSHYPDQNFQKSKSPNIRHNNHKRESYTRSRSRSPQRRVAQRPLYTNDIWKIYREKISISASEVECSYVAYRKNPESHPSYDQEWNRFWKRRKEELVSQGIDHRSYNYQPEWVRFFRNRLEQLFGEELHKSKITVRKRLNIPLDAEEDSQPADNTLSNCSLPALKIKKTTNSSPEEFQHTKPFMKNVEPPNKRQRVSLDKQNYNFIIPIIADDKPNIIHVLRLMTALENHLGSLGSKIMDLLSKTLVLEKKCSKNPKELEQQILTANNCTLLETAMEKLKGILYAGLLDGNKVHGFNKVIQSTADLLQHADDMGWRNAFIEEYSEKSNIATNDLQKLIEVMQNNKKAEELPLLSQKSLSDTLKELITFQSKDPLDDTLTNRSKQMHFSHDTRPINKPQSSNSTFVGSSFMGSNSANSNDRFKQINPYPPTLFSTNELCDGSINQMRLSNFNTRLNRNAPLGGEYSNEACASDRNNYNNIHINNNKTNSIDMQSMSSSRNENTFRNNMSSFGPQANNFSQLPNMARPSNFNQNSVGGSDSWDRFQHVQQWSFNPQSKQYENK